ncbi:Protein Wiz [Camelus dromedarius]|uniref:Protein Wiz n=1 Tax=Camelus dromedarius TaxID=9838 RepID=A0A5N4CL55_CAMDR|nr:Protein Wiz [Camelus dromedarius]
MDGPLAGGLAAPDRPRGPERLPGPAPREDIEGGAEVAEGEGCIFRSTHYLPVTKEGPRDILDGRGGISGSPLSVADGQPHPGLSEALPRATSATHRISSCGTPFLICSMGMIHCPSWRKELENEGD